ARLNLTSGALEAGGRTVPHPRARGGAQAVGAALPNVGIDSNNPRPGGAQAVGAVLPNVGIDSKGADPCDDSRSEANDNSMPVMPPIRRCSPPERGGPRRARPLAPS